MSIIQTSILWIYHHFLSFIFIVITLAAGQYIYAEYIEYANAPSTINQWEESLNAISRYKEERQKEAENRADNYKEISFQKLDQEISNVHHEIEILRLEQSQFLGSKLAFLKGEFVRDIKVDIELEIRTQELSYLNELKSILTAKQFRLASAEELERLRLLHMAKYKSLKINEQKQNALKNRHPILVRIPGTVHNRDYMQLKKNYDELVKKNNQESANYKLQKKILDAIAIPQEIENLKISDAELNAIQRSAHTKLNEFKAQMDDNLIAKVKSLNATIPTALAILISIIFTPILIKALFYYLIAPITSRRPPIRLLASVSGDIHINNIAVEDDAQTLSVSAVSKVIELSDQQELLVHAEYLQSSSQQGIKDTKWLLDSSYPLSSLVSGMFALTRIRATSDESYVISSMKNPLIEVGVISIPKGSAIVLQPHYLVGVVQNKDMPVKITRHWRLSSLNAWLTLQLRYLVFHGEAELIIKGCRGIKIERSGLGRSINQAATIGFSANLAYSTKRSETFIAYLFGKQELLNDHFSGSKGFYIYEEMPYFGKKSGVTGRGLEGISDSILKIFGV